MTPMTALIIKASGNDIRCEAYGQDEKTKKWAGAIILYNDGILHSVLFASKPKFETGKESVEEMEKIVQAIKKVDLSAMKIFQGR